MVRLAVVSILAVLAFGSTGRAQSTLTFKQAYAIAQKLASPMHLIKARKETGVFGFYFYAKGRLREIEIRENGGEVKKDVESEIGDNGIKGVSADVLRLFDKQVKAKVKLPEGRILEIAAESLKDTPLADLTYDKDGDTLIVKIGKDLVINAETGEIIPGDKK
jgi:hypothetical protein